MLTFSVNKRVFPILVLDLARLDEFIKLHIYSLVDCAWIGKMFIYTMHNVIDYSWISKK